MLLFSAFTNCLVISVNSGENKGYSLGSILSRHSICLRDNTLTAHVGIASYTSNFINLTVLIKEKNDFMKNTR